jgi:anti-sigma B factor antagonist
MQSRVIHENIVVLSCQGRIVSGDEVQSLQRTVEELTAYRKKVVLDLAETNFIDSAGLGALVRILGALRTAGGDLKLCQLPPLVREVLQVANLLSVFGAYDSAEEAAASFAHRPASRQDSTPGSQKRVVCVDGSRDVLAYLNVLLRGAGYEVFTTKHPTDAVTLVGATRPHAIVYGAEMAISDLLMERFLKHAPNAHVVRLPLGFSNTEAGQAGTNLVGQLKSLLGQ